MTKHKNDLVEIPQKDRNKKVYREGKRIRVITQVDPKLMTNQQFKDECDINNIVRRQPHLPYRQNVEAGFYADLSEIPDYDESLRRIMSAQDKFNSLPSDLRNRFGNNPQQLIDFLADSQNDEESYKLGLKIKKEEPKPDPTLETLKNIEKNTKSRTKKTSESED